MNYIKNLHQCRFLFWFNNHMALVTIVVYPENVLKWLIVTNHIKVQTSTLFPFPSASLLSSHSPSVSFSFFSSLYHHLHHHPHNNFQNSPQIFISQAPNVFNQLLIDSIIWIVKKYQLTLFSPWPATPHATCLTVNNPLTQPVTEAKKTQVTCATSSTVSPSMH